MSRQQYLIYYFALGDGFAAAAAAAWGLWDNFNWQIPNYKLCKIWAKGVGCAHPWSHHVRCTDNIINAQFNVIFKFQSGICNQMYRSQQSRLDM